MSIPIWFNQPLQNAATTGNGTAVSLRGATEHNITVKWGTGVTAGTLSIETADDTDYTGTWGVLQSLAFSGTAPNIASVQLTGALGAIRARFSANADAATTVLLTSY